MHIAEPANKTLHFLVSIFKRLLLVPRSFSLVRLEFPETADGQCFTYLGEGESLPYLKTLFDSGSHGAEAVSIPIWRFRKTLREIEHSGTILCLEVNRLLRPFVPEKLPRTFPWVRQRVVFSQGEFCRRKKSLEATYGRKVRKYGYQFRLLTDNESLTHFYSELYLPHIRSRFRESGCARGRNELERAVRSGFLLQVLHDDVWVSGAVCRLQMKELQVLAFGHLPNDIFPMRMGALSAAYYYLSSYAERNDLESIDYLRSRPNADDGIYWHKSRWGAVPEKDSWPHTAMWMSLPGGLPVPRPLEKLLVWNGRTFDELETVRQSL
jgi:hypothetical protein